MAPLVATHATFFASCCTEHKLSYYSISCGAGFKFRICARTFQQLVFIFLSANGVMPTARDSDAFSLAGLMAHGCGYCSTKYLVIAATGSPEAPVTEGANRLTLFVDLAFCIRQRERGVLPLSMAFPHAPGNTAQLGNGYSARPRPSLAAARRDQTSETADDAQTRLFLGGCLIYACNHMYQSKLQSFARLAMPSRRPTVNAANKKTLTP
jgi:hypothetical protein